MNEKDLQNLFKPFSAISDGETINSLHFRNKELLFNTIQTLSRQKIYRNLNSLCKLYLKNNTENDVQRRLVESFMVNQDK